MARFALVTWDGGGNVSVMLGVAAALVGRGHRVTVIAPASLRAPVTDLGLGYVALGPVPPTDPDRRGAYLVEVAVGAGQAAELGRIVAAHRADALVVDCNLAWALRERLAPTAIVVHTALGLYGPVWQQVLATADPGGPTAAEGWAGADRLIVTSVAAFDRPVSDPRLRPTYVGVVADPRAGHARPAARTSGDLAVVSYSTDALQNGPRRLQCALDGLAALPVTVLASTSGVVDRDELRVPANATVAPYLPLGEVLDDAALVVCHGGHGTTMAALCRGVPLVAVPGLGRDQAPIAARVVELGLGLAVPTDATAEQIAAAAAELLADHGYRDRAGEFARRAPPGDGANRVAAELEAMANA